MIKNKQFLNGDQVALVAELTETYKIKREEIKFFEGDPEPFIGYEASCKMLNTLINPKGIDAFPVESPFEDSIEMKVVITNRDDSTRSNVGVANKNETDEDGQQLSKEQLITLANARALRSTLRMASINLIELHKNGGNLSVSSNGKSNRASLLAQAHALGRELGFIFDDVDAEGKKFANKKLWHRLVLNRYSVDQSGDLDDRRLADFVAFLRSCRAPQVAAAAGH